jgi:hypothetical protein
LSSKLCFVSTAEAGASKTLAFPSWSLGTRGEPAPKRKLRLDSVMRQVVERKERRMVALLLLPAHGAVATNTVQKDAPIFLFREMQNQGAAVYKPPKS